MFNNSDDNKPSIDKSLNFLCNILAAIVALLSCAQIYDFSFDWAYQYFTNAWNSPSLGELGAYAFVGLSTLTVFQICKIGLQICLIFLAENILIRLVM